MRGCAYFTRENDSFPSRQRSGAGWVKDKILVFVNPKPKKGTESAGGKLRSEKCI